MPERQLGVHGDDPGSFVARLFHVHHDHRLRLVSSIVRDLFRLQASATHSVFLFIDGGGDGEGKGQSKGMEKGERRRR